MPTVFIIFLNSSLISSLLFLSRIFLMKNMFTLWLFHRISMYWLFVIPLVVFCLYWSFCCRICLFLNIRFLPGDVDDYKDYPLIDKYYFQSEQAIPCNDLKILHRQNTFIQIKDFKLSWSWLLITFSWAIIWVLFVENLSFRPSSFVAVIWSNNWVTSDENHRGRWPKA